MNKKDSIVINLRIQLKRESLDKDFRRQLEHLQSYDKLANLHRKHHDEFTIELNISNVTDLAVLMRQVLARSPDGAIFINRLSRNEQLEFGSGLSYSRIVNDIEGLFNSDESGLKPHTTDDSVNTPANSPTKPLYLLVDPGSAPPEEIAKLLTEISTLYRMLGGSGITFAVSGAPELAEVVL